MKEKLNIVLIKYGSKQYFKNFKDAFTLLDFLIFNKTKNYALFKCYFVIKNRD